jgi:hypothetical protein
MTRGGHAAPPARAPPADTLARMALAFLAAFWIIVALFLLFAPDDVFRSGSPRVRRYGAAGCFIFAVSCLVALGAL